MNYSQVSYHKLKQFDKILFRSLNEDLILIYLCSTTPVLGASNITSYTKIYFYHSEEDIIWSGMYSTSDIFKVLVSS